MIPAYSPEARGRCERMFATHQERLPKELAAHRIETMQGANGHLFITMIAYQLVQMVRTRLRQAGENASWTTLRRILEGQQGITATFRRADGATLHARKATHAEPPQQAIYDALGIDPTPGGIRKTVVQIALELAVVVPLADFECRNRMMRWGIVWVHGKDGSGKFFCMEIQASAILVLRCCILSNRFDDFWERRNTAAYHVTYKIDVRADSVRSLTPTPIQNVINRTVGDSMCKNSPPWRWLG